MSASAASHSRPTGAAGTGSRRRSLLPASLVACLALAVAPRPSPAQAKLQPETVRAFEEHARTADRDFESRLSGEARFLRVWEDPRRADAVSQGKIAVAASLEIGYLDVPGGLIHDWTAAALVPGARVEQVVDSVTSYDSHATTYAPMVVRSRILSRDGGKYRVAMRMLARNVLTAVLETEHAAEFARIDDGRWWGRSRSTSIREVVRPGKPGESLRPVGDDSGFLWRMRVFWRFAQTKEGTVAEYRAITLTRGIPKALRWMLRPVLTALPRNAMEDVLRLTREAALARGAGGAQPAP